MNWDAIGFDWNQVRAFLATAEEGSFSAASRVLGLTQPTLGRQVAALESELGVTLFERVGRSLALTDSGLELLEHVRAMADAATRISMVASGHSQAVEGEVRITASDVMSAYVLPQLIRELRESAPLIRVEIIAANDIHDLLRREADIAIRHVRPTQPGLIAQLVHTSTARLYASTSYLERVGRPQRLEDLAGLDFISYGDAPRMVELFVPLGIPVSSANFKLSSASGIVGWELVRHGLGIAMMSDEVGQATPEVEPAVPAMEPVKFPTYLATHRELHTSRRIRVVFDSLVDFFSRSERNPALRNDETRTGSVRAGPGRGSS
ncbi:MAG: LysR family transcriptional regulator [Polyangiaceae bacterium]